MLCVQPTCTCECIWLKTLTIESRQTSKHSCEAKQKGSYSAVAPSRETTQINYLTTPFYHDHYKTTNCRGYWSPHGSRAPTALSFDYVVDPPPGIFNGRMKKRRLAGSLSDLAFSESFAQADARVSWATREALLLHQEHEATSRPVWGFCLWPTRVPAESFVGRTVFYLYFALRRNRLQP